MMSNTDDMFMRAAASYKMGRYSESEQWYKKILEQGPDAIAYNELGCLCYITGRITQALEYQQKAVDLSPNMPEFRANLAKFLIATGRRCDGIEMLRRAVEEMPENSQIHSNLLHHLHQSPDTEPQVIFDEHKKWAARHAPADCLSRSYNNTPEPDRRLRIGYISPDFHEHYITYLF